MNQNTFGVFFKPMETSSGGAEQLFPRAHALRSIMLAGFFSFPGRGTGQTGTDHVKCCYPCFLLLGRRLCSIPESTNVWQLYLLQGVVIGLASSGPFVCVMSMVAKWHDKSLALPWVCISRNGPELQ